VANLLFAAIGEPRFTMTSSKARTSAFVISDRRRPFQTGTMSRFKMRCVSDEVEARVRGIAWSRMYPKRNANTSSSRLKPLQRLNCIWQWPRCTKMKLGFDACDHCRRQELAIGVQDEQIAQPVKDDAAARPGRSIRCQPATYIEFAPIEALRSKMPIKESGNFGERFLGLRRLSV
jgi:hypothetical protein